MARATTTLGAIVGLFDGSTALAADFAGTGGLWVGGVPDDRLALPQCALVDFHEKPEWNFENAVVEDTGEFKFVLYAVGLAAAEALAKDIKAVFDPSSVGNSGFVQLPLTGAGATATSAWLERQDYQVRAVEYRAADSSWVYEITMPYKTFVARLI